MRKRRKPKRLPSIVPWRNKWGRFEDRACVRRHEESDHRSCVMRAAYFAQYNPAISEAVPTLPRRMSAPTDGVIPDAEKTGTTLA